MKKSLLALAALGAFAGSAQAQSSVTVYGIIDAGFLSTNATNGGANANGTAAVAASADGATAAVGSAAGSANGGKRVTSSLNSGMLSTSRLGFRGVEDLGGGTSASFVAEIGLSVTGNGFSGSTNNASSPMGTGYVHNSAVLDNRQTFVGLSQKGLGEARIGRQYTPVHEAMCGTNAGGCNAVAGDMIYSGANSTNGYVPANLIGVAAQIRASNSIRFATENISGFQAVALMSVNNLQNENSANTSMVTQAGQGSTNYRLWGANVSYSGVKNLDIRFSQQTTALNRDNVVATAISRTVLGNSMVEAIPAGTQAIARIEQKDTYGNISYDFGPAKVALQHVALKVTTAGAQSARRFANQVAVSAPVSKTISAWASYGQGKIQAATSAQDFKFDGMQLGTIYNLSKRTNLYAIYGQAGQDAVTGQASKYKDQQYALGVRHSF